MAGFNKFILFSAHGQVSSTIVAVHKLGIEGNFVLSLHWYDFLRDNQDVLEDAMWHADEAETSVQFLPDSSQYLSDCTGPCTFSVTVAGGAMQITNGSPTVQNCIFTNCSVTGGDGGRGANGIPQHPVGFDGGWGGWAWGLCLPIYGVL